MASAPNAFRTRFVGIGLDEFEGRGVTVVTTIRLLDGVTCRAADRATVTDGAFEARSDNRRDDAVYPRNGAFIDLDGDGTCSADADLVWTRLSIAPPPEQEDTVELSASNFIALPDDEGCALLR